MKRLVVGLWLAGLGLSGLGNHPALEWFSGMIVGTGWGLYLADWSVDFTNRRSHS